jgi:hypothetical protein
VWGTTLTGIDDRQNHTFNVLKHLIVPEAQDCDSLAGKKLSMFQISLSFTWFRMLPTIDLDSKPKLNTKKVANAQRYRVLPAGTMVWLILPRYRPKLRVCFGATGTKIASVIPGLFGERQKAEWLALMSHR